MEILQKPKYPNKDTFYIVRSSLLCLRSIMLQYLRIVWSSCYKRRCQGFQWIAWWSFWSSTKGLWQTCSVARGHARFHPGHEVQRHIAHKLTSVDQIVEIWRWLKRASPFAIIDHDIRLQNRHEEKSSWIQNLFVLVSKVSIDFHGRLSLEKCYTEMLVFLCRLSVP